MHGVVDHGEVVTVQERLNGREVKHGLEKRDVDVGGTDNLDVNLHVASLIGDLDLPDLGNINGREGFGDIVGGDGLGVGKHVVGEKLLGGSAVLAVVFDTKVLVGSSGVVGGGENKGPKGFLPLRTLLTDDCGDSRCGEEAVLSDPDAVDAVGDGNFGDGLNCGIVEEPAITADEEGAIGNVGSSAGEGVEG